MNARAYLYAVAALAACGKGTDTATGGDDDDTTQVDAPLADSPNPTVNFVYTPGWDGVVTVEVVGAPVGATGTWPVLATLTKGSGGTFSGTTQLAGGNYDYVIHTIGDMDGAKSDMYEHYAIDPSNPAFEACPMDSPTFGNDPNPCSVLTVPQGAPAATFHVTGTVMSDDKPASGFIVLIERQEPQSHHFFANRVTTGSDGTYDMPVAAGSYRVQIQHPQFEMKNDSQLDPTKLPMFRRSISSSVAIAADTPFGSTQMAFHDYAKFAPVMTATLPTVFTYTTMSSKLDVYGTGNEIGDPWFNGTVDGTGTTTFDGNFNTNKAKTDAVVVGTKYFWGIEAPIPAVGGGPTWTSQSLAFPITWAAGT